MAPDVQNQELIGLKMVINYEVLAYETATRSKIYS
jgi:hypothetical protein